METALPPQILIIFVLFGAVMIVVLVVGLMAASKRRQAMQKLAAELGMTFYHDDPFDIRRKYDHFAPLNRGHSRRAYSVLDGEYRGRRATVFDYRYTTGSGKDQHTHRFSAALIELGAAFPTLSIRRENVLDKIAGAIGFDDIDFESAEFSRKFFVKCESRKFAYDIVHTGTMEYLLARERSGLGYEFARGRMLIYSSGTWRPEQIRGSLDEAADFIDLIPDYVWEDLRGRSA